MKGNLLGAPAMNARILDVVIVGGGFAGSALAAVLAARGRSVMVCDPHDVHPQDFRAEKLSPDQIDALERLGLATPVLRAATPVGDLRIARAGRVVDTRPTREFGLDYRTLVEAIREQVPAASFARRRVEGVESFAGHQIVTLHGAPPLRAKLVVLATGLALSLRKSLGLERAIVGENYSLSIGFDLAVAPSRVAGAALTYYGERIADRIGYLTLFPIRDRLRANLFVYRDAGEAWSRDFRANPESRLDALMPGLRAMLPPFTITAPPVLRPINLFGPPLQGREGIVLIGDAYSTTCPAGGGGLSLALTDITRLLAFLPSWLARAEAITVADVDEYYRDPVKRVSEAEARRASHTSRATAIDPGLYWEARRRRNDWGTRVGAWLKRGLGAGHATAVQNITSKA